MVQPRQRPLGLDGLANLLGEGSGSGTMEGRNIRVSYDFSCVPASGVLHTDCQQGDTGEFGDDYWRIFTCEPCWPANGEDTWLFNGGPAFDTKESAEKYLRALERERYAA